MNMDALDFQPQPASEWMDAPTRTTDTSTYASHLEKDLTTESYKQTVSITHIHVCTPTQQQQEHGKPGEQLRHLLPTATEDQSKLLWFRFSSPWASQLTHVLWLTDMAPWVCVSKCPACCAPPSLGTSTKHAATLHQSVHLGQHCITSRPELHRCCCAHVAGG